jgi:hypothetical protein
VILDFNWFLGSAWEPIFRGFASLVLCGKIEGRVSASVLYDVWSITLNYGGAGLPDFGFFAQNLGEHPPTDPEISGN